MLTEHKTAAVHKNNSCMNKLIKPNKVAEGQLFKFKLTGILMIEIKMDLYVITVTTNFNWL